MAVVTTRQLLESGVHFGHQTRRWNPKMKRFIFTERNGIYIIDLQQSLTYIDRAYAFVKDTVARGGQVLFVGTKKQAQETIAEQATRVGMPYVNQRWLGGMLTNFDTMIKRIQRLKELEGMDFDDVAASGLTKKELLGLRREKDKLEKTLGGIRDMTRHPAGGLDRRHQEGAPGRRRGPQAADPGDRHPRHQLRSRRGRLRDPGQRRRDPLRLAADPGDRRRRGRGPDVALRRRSTGETEAEAEPMPDWERELLGASRRTARRRRRGMPLPRSPRTARRPTVPCPRCRPSPRRPRPGRGSRRRSGAGRRGPAVVAAEADADALPTEQGEHRTEA